VAGHGTTIFLTTHYMDEAQILADQVAVMSMGEIIAAGPPQSVGASHTTVVRFRLQDTAGRPGCSKRSEAPHCPRFPTSAAWPPLR
jgi:ABC-type multidrug transport system ATPase subunit